MRRWGNLAPFPTHPLPHLPLFLPSSVPPPKTDSSSIADPCSPTLPKPVIFCFDCSIYTTSIFRNHNASFWAICIHLFTKSCKPAVPNLFGTRHWFHGRQFFHELGRRDGFQRIQVHYVYCGLYFYYYYLSSISEHQALDPRGWEPLPKRDGGQVILLNIGKQYKASGW